MLTNMTQIDMDTIRLALRVAAERFKEDSQEFCKVKKAGGSPFITVQGAASLEDQFIRQHEDCLNLLEKIDELD
jgi:hypothetical protein